MMCIRHRIIVLSIGMLCSMILPAGGRDLSQSFELRYFTPDRTANGETDFKGETAVFDTEQRVEFLRRYAGYARTFFRDPDLDTRAVPESDLRAALRRIKPQPLPDVRERIPLVLWKRLGYAAGQYARSVENHAAWVVTDGVEIRAGALVMHDTRETLHWTFPSQSWRFSIQWRVRVPRTNQLVAFELSDRDKIIAATVGLNARGRIFYRTAGGEEHEAGTYRADTWYTLKVECDLATGDRRNFGRYNFYVDDRLVGDYVTLQRAVTQSHAYNRGFTSIGQVNRLSVRTGASVTLDDIHGVGYQLTGRESYPYTMETFLDERFEQKPDIDGWEQAEYDDTGWDVTALPAVYGGERYAGEDLYLRKEVVLGDFSRAILNVETLDPGGEIRINGRIAAVLPNRHPAQIDITPYLRKNASNLIAVKVNHFYLTEAVGEFMPHTALDLNIGWFAGRMSLDLTAENTIEDVFVYTGAIGSVAELKARFRVHNRGYTSFSGNAVIRVYPWYPRESATPVAESTLPVVVSHGGQELTATVRVPDAQLWTCESPALYKVQVVLTDTAGEAVDDYVVTTGIRTVGQDGGTFRLNGKPAMLNGAQIMGFRGPIGKLVTWQRCPPKEWVARELLMVRNMNGNLLRIHVHGWEHAARNVNDPRYAEMADQLGIMLIWGTPSWIRTGWGWGQIDFEGLPKYMRQVYNHPSIVMWEIANHTQSFKGYGKEESNLYCEKAYNTVYPLDPSRIISYNSYIAHFHYGNDAGTIDYEGNPMTPSPAWTAPMVTRGNQDSPTGYGKEWSVLRNWPGAYRQDFLDSPARAYFNFEHEESIAQPNWTLVKGKPWYRMQSYEWSYDEGSIGRRLTADEWLESQGWQAFAAWESMKKQRYLDYDGFSWCCLHGGPNTVTYKKPIIDFLGHAKLAYWVNRMVFQKVVAGSRNVDVVYGPDDMLEPVVMNLGGARTVDLTVVIRDLEGNVADRREYRGIALPAGRTATVLDAFRPRVPGEGYYAIEYVVE